MGLQRSPLTLGIMAVTLMFGKAANGQVRLAGIAANTSVSAQDKDTIAGFESSAKTYLNIERNAPPQAHPKRSADLEEIEGHREALKKAVREARPNAKQGDLFTQPVADLIRRQLRNALSGPDGSRLRRTLQNADPPPDVQAHLTIDGDYPNKNGQPLQSAPGTLLQHLPLLPKGLEYRIVGSTLVLRDTAANIVVDYLPNAVR